MPFELVDVDEGALFVFEGLLGVWELVVNEQLNMHRDGDGTELVDWDCVDADETVILNILSIRKKRGIYTVNLEVNCILNKNYFCWKISLV